MNELKFCRIYLKNHFIRIDNQRSYEIQHDLAAPINKITQHIKIYRPHLQYLQRTTFLYEKVHEHTV